MSVRNTMEGASRRPPGARKGPGSLQEGSAAERGRQGSSRRAGLRREDEREDRSAHSQTQIGSQLVSAYPAHDRTLTQAMLSAGCLSLRECEELHAQDSAFLKRATSGRTSSGL